MGEATFTNLEDELFGQGKEGMFLENDVRDINMFESKQEDFSIDQDFLNYLNPKRTGESEKPIPDKDIITPAVKEMYTQLNYVLERNALPHMGDFWSLDSLEIQKTMNLVSMLIKRRGEDMGSKLSIAEGKLLTVII
jgi:hypothetical protein